MEREDPDHVLACGGGPRHTRRFNVLDLFANDEFWSAEHKVLEGGRIDPPLVYDPADGGVLTITFDIVGTFNFKDYHDETTAADGEWEIRPVTRAFIPFPPGISCTAE